MAVLFSLYTTSGSVVCVCTMFLIVMTMARSAPQYEHDHNYYSSHRRNSSRNMRGVNNGGFSGDEYHHGHNKRHVQSDVQTKSGKLRGIRRTIYSTKQVYVYYGIPFAKKPLGNLRFRKPEPVEPWNHTLIADKPPKSCYQEKFEVYAGFQGEEMWNPTTAVSEDCLYMNLWVPRNAKKNKNKKLPVLVWIYGGGYMSGSISLDVYNAEILAAENDAIVATINYRVGAFGFLYLGKEYAPGNMGMYDQVMAMNWIKDNIASFGGDPELITLFGESAGGGSVAFHLLSPLSRHLLKRGIIQSGPVNAPWSIMDAATAKKNALTLINDSNCNPNNTLSEREAVECLRGLPASTISSAQWNTYQKILKFPSAPTIDGEFLPKHPLDMLREGNFKKTELLIGSNKNEGTYFMLYDYTELFDKEKSKCLPRETFLEIINTLFGDRTKLEREAILFQYTHWEDIRDEKCQHQDLVAEVVGDYNFICPTNKFAEEFSRHGSTVYYYYFTQRTSSNPWGEWMGVLHADEIEYVFGIPLNHSVLHTENEMELSRRIMKHFVRFAETGRPTENEEEWPPYTKEYTNHYILNSETKGQIGTGLRAKSCAFWNEFMPLITPGTSSLPCNENCLCTNAINKQPSSMKATNFHVAVVFASLFVSSLVSLQSAPSYYYSMFISALSL